MEVIAAVTTILAVLVLFIYFQFQPDYKEKRALKAYNGMVIAVCAMFCLVWLLNVKTSLPGTEAEKYMGATALAGASAIIAAFLSVCFVLRNFWIFRVKRPGDWM